MRLQGFLDPLCLPENVLSKKRFIKLILDADRSILQLGNSKILSLLSFAILKWEKYLLLIIVVLFCTASLSPSCKWLFCAYAVMDFWIAFFFLPPSFLIYLNRRLRQYLPTDRQYDVGMRRFQTNTQTRQKNFFGK
jgi:hypothetical protein